MAATVQLNQYWGTTAATKQANITRHDYLSADVAQSSDLRSTYPIDVEGGTNYSFEVYQTLEVTAMGGSVEIDTIRHYTVSAAPETGIALVTSAQTGTPSDETAATPVDTNSTKADQSFPTTDPTAANISGDIVAANESGYVVTQADVGPTATIGYSQDTTWKYAETA